MDLVSVIIPVYNASRFLSKTLDSVCAQTYSNIEIIIIDDCSEDDSLKIAYKYANLDSRIRVIHADKNRGVAEARNLGILEAKGKFIALLDSDDLWTNNKIERQVKLIRDTNAGIVYCSYDFIDELGNQVLKPFIVPKTTSYKKMLTCSVISCSTAMIKAEIIKKHSFNPIYYHEDYALWMELLSLPIAAVGDTDILMHYRQVSGSRSNKKTHSAKERWKIYRNYLHLGLTESIFCFMRYAIKGIHKYFCL